MKRRKGLVSNSSSSSFCIIGLQRWKVGDKIMDKVCKTLDLNSDTEEHGEITSELIDEPIQAWGSYDDGVYYVGLDAEWAFTIARMSFEDAVDLFIEEMKENYLLEINRDHVGFYYGEVGSG